MPKLIVRSTPSSAPSTAADLAKEILLGRGINPSSYLESRYLADLTPPFSLKNIEHAAHRLIAAIDRQEHIALITDHDCDGQTSCATLYWCLTEIFHHPLDKISYYIGHRTEEGYGLSPKLCERLLESAQRPSLVITADCGSSDHLSVELLASFGIDVIITDHHTVPPQGPPPAAYAVINPNQPGCSFPDKYIAGCFVAWFFMAATRFFWQQKDSSKKFHSLAPALEFVAIGTMADCVSLANSANNRIVVRYGLKQIRAHKRPCWRALKRTFQEIIDSDFLVFKLIPLINADGRLSNALTGVSFLLAPEAITAQEKLAELIQCNEQRRFLQKKQLLEAKQLIKEQQLESQPGIFLHLEAQGHAGIHGVTASRILEQYQKMVILFSPSHEPGIIVGSARSPDTVSIKNMLDALAQDDPLLIKRYGGHHQAAGLALEQTHFQRFREKAQDYLRNKTSEQTDLSTISIDVSLQDWSLISFDFFAEIEDLLEPFGKGFARPTFLLEAIVVGGRVMGGDKNHLQLDLQHPQSGVQLKSLLFFADEAAIILDKLLEKNIFVWGQFVLQEFQKEKSVSFFIQSFCYKNIFFDDKRKALDYVESALSIEFIDC